MRHAFFTLATAVFVITFAEIAILMGAAGTPLAQSDRQGGTSTASDARSVECGPPPGAGGEPNAPLASISGHLHVVTFDDEFADLTILAQGDVRRRFSPEAIVKHVAPAGARVHTTTFQGHVGRNIKSSYSGQGFSYDTLVTSRLVEGRLVVTYQVSLVRDNVWRTITSTLTQSPGDTYVTGGAADGSNTLVVIQATCV